LAEAVPLSLKTALFGSLSSPQFYMPIFAPVLSQVSFMLIFYHNSRPNRVTEVRMGNIGLTVSSYIK
jgi:hypothetical protein